MRRAFVVVIDACGVGALPDAELYGDSGANTLAHVACAVGGLRLPVLQRLGLGSILPLDGVPPAAAPVLHGRLHALGAGTTAGHWELMGLLSQEPLPTYPEGFPAEVLALIGRVSGREVICNRPYNGLDAIEDYGPQHLQSGALILYTSQDSVLQIAAHEREVALERLHEICRTVRAQLPSRHRVGRVIARPFTGSPGHLRRAEGRRDFSVVPPGPSYLDELGRAGVPVHTVGKAGQLFDGVGIEVQHPGATNAIALEQTGRLIDELDRGMVLTNLIETDQVYGHRHDAPGFRDALQRIDTVVGEWLTRLSDEDLLVLSADHGCDVAAEHTDHTREHVPVLAVFPGAQRRRHDGPMADVGASALMWCAGARSELPGTPFIQAADARAA